MRVKARYLGGVSLLTVIGTAAPAHAQSAEDWAAMQAQLAELKAEVQALRAELDSQGQALNETRGAAQAANDRAAAAETQFAGLQAGAPQPTVGKPGPEIQWKGAPNIVGDNGWSFKPRGRLQYDAAYVSAPDGVSDKDLGFSNELRRARLGAEGTMPGGFGYKLELEFADSQVAFTDAFLSYADDGLVVTAGQHNNFQSLAEMTSGNDESFLERPFFTDAFGFEYRVGLSAQYLTDSLLMQAGVFTASIDDLSDSSNDTVGLSGRAVFMPSWGRAQLHLGASAHYRDLGDTDPTLRYRQRPFVHSTDVRFIDTGAFSADRETNYGLEAAFVSGRLHGAAETHWQRVDRPGFDNPTFFGGYAELGYFLTDHARGYSAGIFKAPKVADGVGEGGIGAIQLVGRYDYVDLDDAGIFGGRQRGYEAGISWWPAQYVRAMLNYARVELTDAPTGGDGGSDVVGGRIQVVF